MVEKIGSDLSTVFCYSCIIRIRALHELHCIALHCWWLFGWVCKKKETTINQRNAPYTGEMLPVVAGLASNELAPCMGLGGVTANV